MSEWLGYASSGQHQWKYRDRARNWQATRDQSQRPTDRKVADFVDGLKSTTVLRSWMHSAEVDWNASNQRRQRHSQQHVSVDCRCSRADRNRRSGCRRHISADTVQRILPAVPYPLYIEERVSAQGPTPVGLHTTPVVESTWIQDCGRTECGWRGTNWSTCERHRWRRGKSSNDAVKSGDQQYQMQQTCRAVLASTDRRDQRQSKCPTGLWRPPSQLSVVPDKQTGDSAATCGRARGREVVVPPDAPTTSTVRLNWK